MSIGVLVPAPDVRAGHHGAAGSLNVQADRGGHLFASGNAAGLPSLDGRDGSESGVEESAGAGKRSVPGTDEKAVERAQEFQLGATCMSFGPEGEGTLASTASATPGTNGTRRGGACFGALRICV